MMRHLLYCTAVLLAACGAQQPPQISTPVVEGTRIQLITPDTVGGLSVNEALWKRSSAREYAAEPLTLEELSGVLWAAAGINRPANDHLTAPSALGLYPIRTYAFLPGGVYSYDAKANELIRVADGDCRAEAGLQPFVAEAPLNIVYIADLSAYEGRAIPVEKVRYLCGQDAAGYAENVNLYAAGHGLKSITRGGASPSVLKTLGLDSVRYCFALAQSVGK